MTARTQGATGKDKPGPKRRATEMMSRVRRAIFLVLGMLSLSLLLVVLGFYTTTRTESLNVSGYISGVILTLGSFLGLLGLCLEENRKQLLTAAIVFLSFGTIISFLCTVIDGLCIVSNMDMRPLKAGRCQYYSSGGGYVYENFYTSVSCWNPTEWCNMTVRSGTCYCCDLYNCANGGYLNNYYDFIGVRSCEEVYTLYILTWTLTGLNLVAFFIGILTTAVLGSIKNLAALCLSPPPAVGAGLIAVEVTSAGLPGSAALSVDVTPRSISERRSGAVNETSESTASSPTAPLLMDANTHMIHQLHPGASMFYPQTGVTLSSQSFPSPATPHTECNTPPVAPLSSLLPHRLHSAST